MAELDWYLDKRTKRKVTRHTDKPADILAAARTDSRAHERLLTSECTPLVGKRTTSSGPRRLFNCGNWAANCSPVALTGPKVVTKLVAGALKRHARRSDDRPEAVDADGAASAPVRACTSSISNGSGGAN